MSWLKIAAKSPFSLENIPFGIISISDATDSSISNISTNSTSTGKIKRRPAVAIGDYALDLSTLAQGGAFQSLPEIHQHLDEVFVGAETLNRFAALGRPLHRKVRSYIRQLLLNDTPFPAQLRDNQPLRDQALVPLSKVTNHLPMRIGDYTDFYAGLNHAFNAGVIFRGPENALQPNYKHLPVGYHGRASSIVVSGTPIRRPSGQVLGDPAKKTPVFSECKKMDWELELAAFICKSNEMGSPVPIAEAEDHIFGYVLMNDWSARDIQAWEYVPLGPFNGKNFGTTISPWVVLADALEPFRTQNLDGGKQDNLMPYLRNGKDKSGFDIELKIELVTGGNSYTVAQVNASNLLYSTDQMVAHHTVTGCNMNVGDLLGSGTISGKDASAYGSLLESSQNGKTPLQLDKNVSRTFLEDGDEVIMTGIAGHEGSFVGFGECKGRVLPAFNRTQT